MEYVGAPGPDFKIVRRGNSLDGKLNKKDSPNYGSDF